MPKKNKLSDLRDHLFETIEKLKDETAPMDIDRAKAVAQVAGQIIESAKVELKALDITGANPSEFLEMEKGGVDHLLPDPREMRRAPRKTLSTGRDLGADPAH